MGKTRKLNCNHFRQKYSGRRDWLEVFAWKSLPLPLPCPALIDLLLLMNAGSLTKSINMLSKLVVKMMKISE